MSVDREVVVASLSVLTSSILKRTMSMRHELCVAYQTSIPPCVQSKIHTRRENRRRLLCSQHSQPYSATSIYSSDSSLRIRTSQSFSTN